MSCSPRGGGDAQIVDVRAIVPKLEEAEEPSGLAVGAVTGAQLLEEDQGATASPLCEEEARRDTLFTARLGSGNSITSENAHLHQGLLHAEEWELHVDIAGTRRGEFQSKGDGAERMSHHAR